MPTDLITPQDPRSQYPGPPSDVEIQTAPGVQADMSEKPDCGELSYKGSGKLAGRKALLTGADSGIGRAAAIAFAREGADVAIGYLPAEQADAEEVANYIREAGRKAVLLPGDVSHEGFCQKLVSDAVDQLGGRQDGQNRGHPGDFDRALRLAYEDEYLFDLLDHEGCDPAPEAGCLHHQHNQHPGLRAIGKHFRLRHYQGGHRQLHQRPERTADGETQRPSPPPYEKHGVRINAVAPGPIWTPLQEADGSKEKLKKLGGSTPYKRPGQPVELAPVYVLLASQEGSYITGEIYGVTGGWAYA